MKEKIILLSLLFVQQISAQQLTIDETLKYIRDIENKHIDYLKLSAENYNENSGYADHIGHKKEYTYTNEINCAYHTVDYSVIDGVFHKKINHFPSNSNVNFYFGEYTAHIDDIQRKVDECCIGQYYRERNLNGLPNLVFECKSNNCFEFYKNNVTTGREFQRYDNRIYVFVPQEYERNKVRVALNYLFSLFDKIKTARDEDDPFANPIILEVSKQTNVKSNKVQLTESRSGTFNIKATFGTISSTFILDTGASETTISNNLEKNLIASGIIKREHYLQDGLYKIADGSIISQRRVLIKQLKVGQFTVKNVVVSIGDNNSPHLLGKNFLDKFKNWSIDNQNKTLELLN